MNPKDVIVSVAPHEPGDPIRVKVTHKPSGKSAEAQESGYAAARDAAMDELEAKLGGQAMGAAS